MFSDVPDASFQSSQSRGISIEAGQKARLPKVEFLLDRAVSRITEHWFPNLGIMSDPYLEWINPHGVQQVYVLKADEILIGRKSDADIVLTSRSVSRHHAKLVRAKDGYSIVDLSNINGTYVNGQRIKQHLLQHGDRICLGQVRTELCYHISGSESVKSEAIDFEKSYANLASILPAQESDLGKISSILDFQLQCGKMFSAERTFEQIIQSALKISGAERGYILLKQNDQFEYVIGMTGQGQCLPQSEFRASRSVVGQVAREGKPIYMVAGIAEDFAEQQSIVNLNLRSFACVPLRWMVPESSNPEVQGVLYLDSTRGMRELSGLDEKILNKLALEAGNVFEKLQMIKTFEERKSLQLELTLAQETQKNLQSELLAAEELRRAESQVLLSENAASMGRFAAAISHELNSPLAVLRSTLQSFSALAEKRLSLPVDNLRAMEEVESQLRKSMTEAAERLHQTVLRMQRFTNMDRTEVLLVDLNLLLQDVVEILKSQIKADVSLQLDLQRIPQVRVRPHQVSAVFSNLLHNAADGVESGGHVWLTTCQIGSQVCTVVRDDGRGIAAEELAGIFDPTFKVKAGRVATGNWGLFSCRQIVREHDGEIEIESTPGSGTIVRVMLPSMKMSDET
jgi:signal transduction histidine kinase